MTLMISHSNLNVDPRAMRPLAEVRELETEICKRLVHLSFEKMLTSRNARGGARLHKNLLVLHLVRRARTDIEMLPNECLHLLKEHDNGSCNYYNTSNLSFCTPTRNLITSNNFDAPVDKTPDVNENIESEELNNDAITMETTSIGEAASTQSTRLTEAPWEFKVHDRYAGCDQLNKLANNTLHHSTSHSNDSLSTSAPEHSDLQRNHFNGRLYERSRSSSSHHGSGRTASSTFSTSFSSFFHHHHTSWGPFTHKSNEEDDNGYDGADGAAFEEGTDMATTLFSPIIKPKPLIGSLWPDEENQRTHPNNQVTGEDEEALFFMEEDGDLANKQDDEEDGPPLSFICSPPDMEQNPLQSNQHNTSEVNEDDFEVHHFRARKRKTILNLYSNHDNMGKHMEDAHQEVQEKFLKRSHPLAGDCNDSISSGGGSKDPDGDSGVDVNAACEPDDEIDAFGRSGVGEDQSVPFLLL